MLLQILAGIFSNSMCVASFFGATGLSLAAGFATSRLQSRPRRLGEGAFRRAALFGVFVIGALALWWVFALAVNAEIYMSIQKAPPV